jgi:hypothetical protein
LLLSLQVSHGNGLQIYLAMAISPPILQYYLMLAPMIVPYGSSNGSSKNKIYDNRIINSVNALRFNAGSHENTLYSNKIINNATLHNR